MEVIFYSTHCPKCKVIEMMLKKKNIEYKEDDDVQHMLDLGLQSAPALGVDGEIMDFSKAVEWIKGQ